MSFYPTEVEGQPLNLDSLAAEPATHVPVK